MLKPYPCRSTQASSKVISKIALFAALASVCVQAQSTSTTTEATSDLSLTKEQKQALAAQKAKTDKAAAEDEDKPIELSPFIVESDSNKGYQASSTLSGSRLNSKLEDVAASISVVTKEQLNDFAAIDINDIFAMEMGVEGTRTYTANSSSSTALAEVDEVAQNPTTANRVRGLGNANIAIGNFSASSTIPIDTYNIDAVEISRGPNSNIFGTGELSGGVNLIPSSANLQKSMTKTSFQATSVGSLRNTIDINRPLFKNVLAVRVSAVANNQTFTRKPSYDKTRRATFGVTFRPFKNTTIRASWENFNEKYSRPNSATPKDYYSVWVAQGKPSWNPVTSTWDKTINGVTTSGTITLATSASSNPYASTAISELTTLYSSRVRNTVQVDQSQVLWMGNTVWYLGTGNANVRELTTLYAASNSYYNVPSAYYNTTTALAGLSYTSVGGSTNKAFYDYENLNLAALNYGKKTAAIGKVELEQFFLNTRKHTLAAQVGAYKEDITDVRRTYIGMGRDGAALVILPDTNRYLSDGSVNTKYGSPYIATLAPQTYLYPIDNQTQKVNVVYQLDLSQEKNKWLRALGRQRLLGYAEYNDRIFSQNGLRFRDQIVNSFSGLYTSAASATNSTWLPSGTSLLGNNSTQLNYRYYVGDNSGNNIDYASSAMATGTYALRRYGSTSTSYLTNSWQTDQVTIDTTYLALGMNQTQVRTKGFTWQGFFLGDRIVPTIGVRKDMQRTRNGGAIASTAKDANGLVIDTSGLWDFSSSSWNYANAATKDITNKGITRSRGLVVKPFKWLSLRYNTSDSFKPGDYTMNYQGVPYGNPHGKTTDYGVNLTLIPGKLNIGVTHYKTVTIGSLSNSTINTYANRLQYIDFDPVAGSDGSKVDLQDWYLSELATARGIDLTTASEAVVSALTTETNTAIGLSDEYIALMRAYTRAISTDEMSKGYEVELNYNPTRYWTLKASGSSTDAVTSNIGDSWQKYLAQRLEVWQTITSPATGEAFWTHYFSSQGSTTQNYLASTVMPTMKLQLALQGCTKPQTRKYKSNLTTNYRLAGLTNNKYLKNANVGTSIRWEDRAIIGYYGSAADSDGLIRSYDINKPIYDSSHTYVDLTMGYDLRLFKGRVKSRLQLNVRNVFEGGRLQCYYYNPDGTPVNQRIVDPREFVLTWSFDI